MSVKQLNIHSGIFQLPWKCSASLCCNLFVSGLCSSAVEASLVLVVKWPCSLCKTRPSAATKTGFGMFRRITNIVWNGRDELSGWISQFPNHLIDFFFQYFKYMLFGRFSSFSENFCLMCLKCEDFKKGIRHYKKLKNPHTKSLQVI